MRILLVHNYYQAAGGESIAFENLQRLLHDKGCEVESYTRHNSELSGASPVGAMAIGLQAYYSLQTQRDIRSAVRRSRPDVAIVQNVFPLISPSVYPALKSEGIPIIQAVYNYRFVCSDAHLFSKGEICERCVSGNNMHAVLRKCYRNSYAYSAWYASILQWHRMSRTFADNIDAFVIPDNFLGRKLVQGGVPAGKMHKIVNPFFVRDYEPQYRQGSYALYVGRLVKQKGVFTLVAAMEAANGASLPLCIVGDGEMKDELELQIQERGLQDRVRLLGPKWGNQLEEVIHESAFLVVPSEWYDNLPMVVCQAFALGKPVVASAINGIPEYVTHEQDGLLFEPADVHDLARCMVRLSQDHALVAKMSHNARQTAETELDIERYWHNLQSVLREVAG